MRGLAFSEKTGYDVMHEDPFQDPHPMTAATYTHDHLVRDLCARILDRLASQDARATQALEKMNLEEEPRLSVQTGLVLVSDGAAATRIGLESLEKIGEHLGREVKENPPASAISSGDLVVLSVDAAVASSGGKALLTRLERQLQALGHSGAMGVLAFEQFNAWPQAMRQKVATLVQKNPSPRLFCYFGKDPSIPSQKIPLLESCQELVVGNEPVRVRRVGMP